MILAFVRDLIFATKIRSTAQSLGIEVVCAADFGRLKEMLQGSRVLIVDLNSAGEEAIPAIRAATTAVPRPRVIAFVAHVNEDLAEAAAKAGADEVMPRSRFHRELPTLLAG